MAIIMVAVVLLGLLAWTIYKWRNQTGPAEDDYGTLMTDLPVDRDSDQAEQGLDSSG